MKTLKRIFIFTCIGYLIIYVAFVLTELPSENSNKYDMPKEFNIHTISRDRKNPKELMCFYDTIQGKFVFEFIDK
jgi:hypothetical protein